MEEAEPIDVDPDLVVAREAVSYTHPDAADERSSVDLGGRRIIKKKKSLSRLTLGVYY